MILEFWKSVSGYEYSIIMNDYRNLYLIYEDL